MSWDNWDNNTKNTVWKDEEDKKEWNNNSTNKKKESKSDGIIKGVFGVVGIFFKGCSESLLKKLD